MKRWKTIALSGITLFMVSFGISTAISQQDNSKIKLVDTIDELEAMFPSAEVCGSCHGDIYEQWKKSFHSQSILHSIDIIYNYVKYAINEDPERRARAEQPGGFKAELMKCFVCHAPQLEYASDKLMREIAQAVIDYYEKKDPKAKDLLSRVTVDCYVCHNFRAVHPPEKPKHNVMYGVKGTGKSVFHGISKHPFIGNSNFCMQCHGAYIAPDGEHIFCSTIAQSYRDHYVPMGGHKSCQDCHMREKNRGHTFPGAYNIEMLKEGLGFDFQVRKVMDTEPLGPVATKRPAVVITADLINLAGHRIPDGCYWTGKVILEISAKDERGREVWNTKKEYFEMGLNWEGIRRWVSYEIKDIIDFSLPPRHTTTERFFAVFPKEVKKVKITAKVKYRIKGNVEFVVHEVTRELDYD